MQKVKKIMLTTASILALLVVAFVILFIVYGYISRSGTTPGLVNGQLQQCPPKQNCVCSEYPDDSSHYVEPVKLTGDLKIDRFKNLIVDMGGVVQLEQDNYLAATFSSALFGFVDDLEVRIDEQSGVIHLRSASRVGSSDLGVNRKRIEMLKDKLS